jgi:hypothetical protein
VDAEKIRRVLPRIAKLLPIECSRRIGFSYAVTASIFKSTFREHLAMRVVVCLTSFNRTDCARISMEIIKLNWPTKWPIVHATADATYERYLDDVLVLREPKPLTRGAMDLLMASMKAAVETYSADYVIHLESDTWVFDQNAILRYLERLDGDPHALIAASTWSRDSLPDWSKSSNTGRRLRAHLAKVLRPLGSNYGIRDRNTLSTQYFIAKCTPELMQLMSSLTVSDTDFLEKLLYGEIVQRFGRRAVINMSEREPLHPYLRNSCPALTLVAHHWPSAADAPSPLVSPDLEPADRLVGKKECLQAAGLRVQGPHMKRLLTSSDLSYYNGSAARR